ncbi:MAG: bacillithiol biosynthesis cysteine-adding enzyme BshC [Mycobacterium leprae]
MRIETVSGVRLNPSPAVEAFLFDFGKVSAAYEFDWTQQESFQQRAAYLNGGGYRGDRKGLAAALLRYNTALGAGSSTLANVEALGAEGSLAVVTGQQAGVFGGPAYSIYKAMTAIHLAQQQSQRLGLKVVPVFWIAGEDHDWREVASVMVPQGDAAAAVALKETFEGERRSVGLAPIPASLAELMPEFLSLLPQTEFTAAVAERIQAASVAPPALSPALTGGKPTLADWFGRLMTWLFDGTGLIICNSADPALRQLEAGFFARVIANHEAVDQALASGHQLWQSLGYTPTVERAPGNLNLFTYVNGDRMPLMAAGTQYWVRDQEEVGWSREELTDMALTHPERFSTNVVLRPVVQGVLFPDLAYVGGPGEISYFGLYRQVYQSLGQQMPIVYPRESFTLVEPALARNLQKQDLALEDVFFRLDEKRQELLQREDRLGIATLFEGFRDDFAAKYEPLVDALVQLDPSLKFVADENRKQIAVQINKLEEKARQQHRKNCEVGLRQFDRLKANLLPDGGLQERSISILPYVAKFGPDLVLRLLAETTLGETWRHQAIYLGE